jgi:hypothetical protein
VEREQLRHVLGVRARTVLDRPGDACVQIATAPVREAVVRGVADEGMAEAKGTGDVGVALDEFGQPLPRLGVRGCGRVVGEHLGDEGARERGTEHGGPAQEGPVGRREPVDPRRHQRLHVHRQLLRLVGRLLRRSELLEEERVAAAARSDRFELVVADAPVPGRCGDQRFRVRLRQRLQAERKGRQRRRALCGYEAARHRPACRAHEPRMGLQLRAQVTQELRRGLVHPVHVLDEQERRRVEQTLEHAGDDAVQAGAAEGGIELVHLGRGRDLDVQRGREQRCPGRQLRVEPV